MVRQKSILTALFFATLILLWSCDRAEQEPIKIGLAINLSGLGGTAGGHIRNGAQLAVEEINADGGINGRLLKLLIKNDKNTREGVLSAVKELIEQEVVVVIGHSTSRNTLIAHPYVTSADTLLFTPFATTSKLSGLDDLFCRNTVDTNLLGQALATLLTSWQIDNVSFLLDMSNPAFVEDYLEQTVRYFSGAVNPVRFNSTARKDWDRIITDLLKTRPQAIILLTEATMTGFSAQKLRARGFQGELLATLWAQTPGLPKYGAGAVDGMTLITFCILDQQHYLFQTFNQAMQRRFNQPASGRSVLSYEAIQIIAEALRQSPPSPTAVDLKKVLLEYRFETLMGYVDFDEFCDVIRPVYEVRIEDGVFHRIAEITMGRDK